MNELFPHKLSKMSGKMQRMLELFYEEKKALKYYEDQVAKVRSYAESRRSLKHLSRLVGVRNAISRNLDRVYEVASEWDVVVVSSVAQMKSLKHMCKRGRFEGKITLGGSLFGKEKREIKKLANDCGIDYDQAANLPPPVNDVSGKKGIKKTARKGGKQGKIHAVARPKWNFYR